MSTGETERKLGDYSSGDSKSNEKRPVSVEFSLEKHSPWIEFPHFSHFLVFVP